MGRWSLTVTLSTGIALHAASCLKGTRAFHREKHHLFERLFRWQSHSSDERGRRQDLSDSAVVIRVMFPQNSVPQHTQICCSHLLVFLRRSDGIFIFFGKYSFHSFIETHSQLVWPETAAVKLFPDIWKASVLVTWCLMRAKGPCSNWPRDTLRVMAPLGARVCILMSDTYIESLVSPNMGPFIIHQHPSDSKPRARLCSGTRKGKLDFISVCFPP